MTIRHSLFERKEQSKLSHVKLNYHVQSLKYTDEEKVGDTSLVKLNTVYVFYESSTIKINRNKQKCLHYLPLVMLINEDRYSNVTETQKEGKWGGEGRCGWGIERG